MTGMPFSYFSTPLINLSRIHGLKNWTNSSVSLSSVKLQQQVKSLVSNIRTYQNVCTCTEKTRGFTLLVWVNECQK